LKSTKLTPRLVTKLLRTAGRCNSFSQLESLYGKGEIEEILQANPYLAHSTNEALVEFARNKGLIFNFVPNFFNVQSRVIDTETVNGIPVISLRNTPLEGWAELPKEFLILSPR